MLVIAALYLLPLGFVLSTSLRTTPNVSDPSQWIPHPLTLEHYVNFLETLPQVGRYAWNTLFIAGLSTAGTLGSSSLAGYALARFRFPGSRVLLVSLLVTLMIPPQVTLIPIYSVFQDAGLINTPWPLIIPMLFGTPFVTFFFRQYFLTLPREYDEAARVDGASWLQVFWRIVVPLSRPAFATMGLLTLIQQWNSYFYPSVYLQREDQWVLTQAIVSLIGQYTSRQGEVMAGIIMMSLPMVLLYVIGQRYVIRGITAGGLKG
jgi:multiple sugar transport system permease protein